MTKYEYYNTLYEIENAKAELYRRLGEWALCKFHLNAAYGFRTKKDALSAYEATWVL